MKSKTHWKMLATLAAVGIVLAMVLVGCPMDTQDKGNGREGGIPAELVGSWGDRNANIAFLTINANGTGTIQDNVARWSVSENRLTLTQDLGAAHGGEVSGSVAWIIVDGRLRLSDGEDFLGMMLESLPDLDRLGLGNGVGPGNGAPTITGIIVSPSVFDVARDTSRNFFATVMGTNNPPQGVTWSIDQLDRHEQTTITAGGVLTVAAAEPLTTLTVRATSTFNTTINGIAIVTVFGHSCEIDDHVWGDWVADGLLAERTCLECGQRQEQWLGCACSCSSCDGACWWDTCGGCSGCRCDCGCSTMCSQWGCSSCPTCHPCGCGCGCGDSQHCGWEHCTWCPSCR